MAGMNPLDVPDVGDTGGAMAVARRIAELEKELADVRASNTSQGAIYQNSSIDIYDASGGLVFHAGPDGTSILENLTLSKGIIGNNALARQLQVSPIAMNHNWDSGEGPGNYMSELEHAEVTVPDFAKSVYIEGSIWFDSNPMAADGKTPAPISYEVKVGDATTGEVAAARGFQTYGSYNASTEAAFGLAADVNPGDKITISWNERCPQSGTTFPAADRTEYLFGTVFWVANKSVAVGKGVIQKVGASDGSVGSYTDYVDYSSIATHTTTTNA